MVIKHDTNKQETKTKYNFIQKISKSCLDLLIPQPYILGKWIWEGQNKISLSKVSAMTLNM